MLNNLILAFGFLVIFICLFIKNCLRGERLRGGVGSGELGSGGGMSGIPDDEKIFEIPDDQLVEEYHVVASGQCNFYQDWQMAVLWWSLRKNWKGSRFTRLLNCNEDARPKYQYGHIMPTMMVSDYHKHPYNGDSYAPYNKPIGVVEFLRRTDIPERWIVLIDPDQIVKKPMDDLKPALGRPVGQKVGFPMPDLHKVAKYFGLKMEDLDLVSVPIIIHQNDLRKIAPLWLKYTEAIRTIPILKKWSGWVAEMYGYILAAGAVGVRHHLRKELGDRIPYNVKNSYSLHYDLGHESKDKKIKWNKRSYMSKDVLAGHDLPMPEFPLANSPTADFASVTSTINQALGDIRKELGSTE